MNIDEILNDGAGDKLTGLLDDLHKKGPIDQHTLEILSYYKLFHSDLFKKVEERIIASIGLFFKIEEASDLYSFLLSGIGKQYKALYGASLTPVQARVRSAVDEHKVVSISAPTSAGKSYSIRDFIADSQGDAVIIVPSRALIAEYVASLKRKFAGDKRVMISAFVDYVFTSRELRRIFVLTPERAREIFSFPGKFDIRIFFLDEAQISEERERGVIFDVLVRRIQKHFLDAKIVFAHPFVENPDAQLRKHGVDEKDGYARSFPYGSVGKICVFRHKNRNSYYFSPFVGKGYQLKNCLDFPEKFEDFAFDGVHTVLVYVSKASIYNGEFLRDFEKHINRFETVEDEGAVAIINTIRLLVGADKEGHNSQMVSLMRKGVVIHHGSVPLEVRFLIEDFIRSGFARLCFATSTLAQGVNMPFDIVWLDNMRFHGESESDRALAFKNLIGRAGRLSPENKFDYGYVFTGNPRLFSRRINEVFRLKEVSVIDCPTDELEEESSELIESIKADTFDEDKQVPMSKVERLSSAGTVAACKSILDLIYQNGRTIHESIGGVNNKLVRDTIKELFRIIFESSINRNMYDGEAAVFDQALNLFLHVIQGRSFSEIVGIRYNYISRRNEMRRGPAKFSQQAERIPKSTLTNAFPLFKDTRAKDVSYDTVVYDTYDYLDQVVSFSLADTFVAAFKVYKDISHDERANKMIELVRLGTNDRVNALLMRYGFPPENVDEIAPYIYSIDESNILFNPDIENAPHHVLEMTEWYRQ